jgi:Tfp pilus assembly protein PilF
MNSCRRRAAALKALQIDETLAEAHASLALIAEAYDYDWQTAEKEFRRAIELDPRLKKKNLDEMVKSAKLQRRG